MFLKALPAQHVPAATGLACASVIKAVHAQGSWRPGLHMRQLHCPVPGALEALHEHICQLPCAFARFLFPSSQQNLGL